jgi:cytochrome c oxidase subunit III
MAGLVSPPASSPVIRRRLEPAKFGLGLFITSEIMFFGGLISALVSFRFGPMAWPPPGQPRLPLEITTVNTFLLLLSGLSFYLALKPLKELNHQKFLFFLTTTAVLGTLFLAVQGVEWTRLLHFGLSIKGSIYGGFFYCLVGTHALHVLGGLVALLWVLSQAWKGAYGPHKTLGVELCRMYWFLVVLLWPVIFLLVYL